MQSVYRAAISSEPCGQVGRAALTKTLQTYSNTCDQHLCCYAVSYVTGQALTTSFAWLVTVLEDSNSQIFVRNVVEL
eukprot:4474269-Amphidinium_carterae.2